MSVDVLRNLVYKRNATLYHVTVTVQLRRSLRWDKKHKRESDLKK